MSSDSTEIALEDVSSPIAAEFVAYWESLRRDRFAPSWAEFDMLGLDPKIIPQLLVVDVIRQPLTFVYRFWGTAHSNAKGFDKTGKSVIEPPRFRGQTTFDEYERMVREKRVLAATGTIELPEFDRTPFKQTIVRVPLSSDGIEVDNIVSLAIWEKRF